MFMHDMLKIESRLRFGHIILLFLSLAVSNTFDLLNIDCVFIMFFRCDLYILTSLLLSQTIKMLTLLFTLCLDFTYT